MLHHLLPQIFPRRFRFDISSSSFHPRAPCYYAIIIDAADTLSSSLPLIFIVITPLRFADSHHYHAIIRFSVYVLMMLSSSLFHFGFVIITDRHRYVINVSSFRLPIILLLLDFNIICRHSVIIGVVMMSHQYTIDMFYVIS